MIVQSVLFPKASFTIEQAKAWLSCHGYKSTKVKLAKDFKYLCFEQYTIRYIKDKCDVSERVITVNKDGIMKVCFE